MTRTCPLFKAGQTASRDYLNDPYACTGETCAWWVRETEHPDCAIVVAALNPVQVDGNTAFVAWIERLINRRIASSRSYPPKAAH